MLEIIAMFSLGKTIRNIALEKGLKPFPYVLSMVLMWIGLELVGATIGLSLFSNMFASYVCALAGAVLGGYLAYQRVLHAQPETY